MPIIVDKNKLIETSVTDILKHLQFECQMQNIPKLKKIEYKSLNARVNCPIHKNGQENTPSCDILLQDKGDINAGTVYCFACGYRANLLKFISDCLNISYSDSIQWLLNFSEYDLVENIRDVNLDFTEEKFNDVYADVQKINVEQLKEYDYFHSYMYERKLTDYVINKFEVGYDPKTDCLTFPVYVNGECLFVAKRKVKYKQFIMPAIQPKPIYGLDYLTEDTVYVCESIINCLTLWSYGKQAVALFGTGSEYQIELLKQIPQRKIILALDGDEAGLKGSKRIAKQLDNKIVTMLNIPKNKDINDLSFEGFNNLEEIII